VPEGVNGCASADDSHYRSPDPGRKKKRGPRTRSTGIPSCGPVTPAPTTASRPGRRRPAARVPPGSRGPPDSGAVRPRRGWRRRRWRRFRRRRPWGRRRPGRLSPTAFASSASGTRPESQVRRDAATDDVGETGRPPQAPNSPSETPLSARVASGVQTRTAQARASSTHRRGPRRRFRRRWPRRRWRGRGRRPGLRRRTRPPRTRQAVDHVKVRAGAERLACAVEVEDGRRRVVDGVPEVRQSLAGEARCAALGGRASPQRRRPPLPAES